MLISTYSLCGFSNLGSVGIQLGALGAMAPSRRQDLALVAVRAMIAGNVACFITACIAGIVFYLLKKSYIEYRKTKNDKLQKL